MAEGQPQRRVLRQMAVNCFNCGRDFFARKYHWACPYCGYAEQPSNGGKYYRHNEDFQSKTGSKRKLLRVELESLMNPISTIVRELDGLVMETGGDVVHDGDLQHNLSDDELQI